MALRLQDLRPPGGGLAAKPCEGRSGPRGPMRTHSPGGAGGGGVLPLPTDALTDGGAARARSLGQRGADGQHRTYKRGQSQPGREELGAEEQLFIGRRRHSPRRTGRTFRRRRKVQRHDCLGAGWESQGEAWCFLPPSSAQVGAATGRAQDLAGPPLRWPGCSGFSGLPAKEAAHGAPPPPGP